MQNRAYNITQVGRYSSLGPFTHKGQWIGYSPMIGPGVDGEDISLGSVAFETEMIAKSNEEVFFVEAFNANRKTRNIPVTYNFKTQKATVLESSVFYGRLPQPESSAKLPSVGLLYAGERDEPIYLAQSNAYVEMINTTPVPRDYHNAGFLSLSTNQVTPEFITFTHVYPVKLLNDQLVLGYENYKYRGIGRYTFSSLTNSSKLPVVYPADEAKHIDIRQLVKISESSAIALDKSEGMLYKLTVEINANQNISVTQTPQPIVEEADDKKKEEHESVLKGAKLCKLDKDKIASIKYYDTFNSSTVRVWETATFKCINTVEVNAQLDEVIPSDDGRTLVGVTNSQEDPALHFIDLIDREVQTQKLEKSEMFFKKVVMLPNNNLLVFSNGSLIEFQWAHEQVKLAIQERLMTTDCVGRVSVLCGLVAEYVGIDIAMNPYSFYAKNGGKPYFEREKAISPNQSEVAPKTQAPSKQRYPF